MQITFARLALLLSLGPLACMAVSSAFAQPTAPSPALRKAISACRIEVNVPKRPPGQPSNLAEHGKMEACLKGKGFSPPSVRTGVSPVPSQKSPAPLPPPLPPPVPPGAPQTGTGQAN